MRLIISIVQCDEEGIGMPKKRFVGFYLSTKDRKFFKESLELKKKGKLLAHKEVFR